MIKMQTRKESRALLPSTSQEKVIKQLLQKVEKLTSEKEELQEMIVQIQKQSLQKDQHMEQLLQTLDNFTTRVDTRLDQSEEREEEMLEAQKESKPLIAAIHKYTKPGLYTAMGSTLAGDLLIDFFKEGVKEAMDEEIKVLGSGIREVAGPWFSSILETAISCFPTFLLITKAAIISLVIAAPILNLTVSLWQAARDGLRKLRSKKASKK